MIFLDPGHGGIDPRTGSYTTRPAKMFRHKRGNFHKGGEIYEGVLNRSICKMITDKLHETRIAYLVTAHDWLDTPLETRVSLANSIARKRPSENHIFISIHNNASRNGEGRGTEVYTSIGNTKSDLWATKYMGILNNAIYEQQLDIKVRGTWTDGDADQEADFYVLRKTTMPAILLECLFFDNVQDASLIIQPEIQELFASAVLETIFEMY